MSSTNGTPPSIPVISGIQDATGGGSALKGAPTVTPPNQAAFNVPNADQIQQALATLQAAKIDPQQMGLQQVIDQQQGLAQQDMNQLQNGPAPGQSAAAIGSAEQMGEAAGQAAGAQQNSLASAANPLAAQRVAGSQQARQNVAIASGAQQQRAQETQAIRQNAQSALASATEGTLSGASQRVQAQIATQNIQQQAIMASSQLAMMRLNASMNYAQMSQQYQLQQQQDYIQAQTKAIQNQMQLIGSIFSAVGAAAGAGLGHMSSPSPNTQVTYSGQQMLDKGSGSMNLEQARNQAALDAIPDTEE